MNKLKNKVLKVLLAVLVLSNIVFAIDSEYKNSLSKVELTKVAEDSYTVNLYTQKQYTNPIKIIKKNDLNYYILLPETKNASSNIEAANADIREVSTNSYPYAGQDVNNGYTKINIKTTKPIIFNVDIKSPQKQAKAKTTLPTKIAYNVDKTAVLNQKKNISNLAPLPIESAKAPVEKKPEPEKKNLLNINPVKQDKKIKQKENKLEIKAKKAPEKKIEKPKVKAVAPVLQVEEFLTDELAQKYAPQEENIEVSDKVVEEFKNALEKDELLEDENENKITILEKLQNKFILLKNKLSNNKTNLILIVSFLGIGFVVFLAVLIALTRKTKPSVKLKNKIELIDDDIKTVENKNKTKMPNGQFFVFDDNIIQTGLAEPVSNGNVRAYELSSYDPELRNEIPKKKSRFEEDNKETEYDIIQKMLREDTAIKVTTGEYDVIEQGEKTKTADIPELLNTEELVSKEQNNTSLTSVKQNFEAMQNFEEEPEVLSRVEIALGRGFMCVSYNDNLSLVGYIYEDVFALQNLKCSSLTDYQIKFRFIESDDNTDDYIVKIENHKILVGVGKNSMQVKAIL